MMYTQEKMQAVSTEFRAGNISVEEAVAVLRNAHDERTGDLIVGEPFVIEFVGCRWLSDEDGRFNVPYYFVEERHLYESEQSARRHGWRVCDNCGEWFRITYDNSEYVQIDDKCYCSQSCAREDGWERCDRCGQWVCREDAFRPNDYDVFCSDYCAIRSGWRRCECDGCGEWTYEPYSVYTNGGIEQWCEDCYDSYTDTCDGCGHAYPSEELEHTDYGECYCPDCSCRNHLHEYGYTPDIKFFGGNAWDVKPPLFMGVELETDSGWDQGEYAADLDEILGFADHFWMTEDSSLDNGVEITGHPMTLAYHVSLRPLYEEIAEVAKRHRYVSHNSGNCGLHVHVNRRFFGKSGILQDAGGYKMLRMLQRFEKQFMIFSRRKDDYWCHFNKERGETYVPEDKVCINKKPSRFYDGREQFGELKMAQLMVGNEHGHAQALNFQHRNTFEFRIFRGTLKWTTYFASLGLVEGMCWTAKAHGSTWVETVDWYTLIGEIVGNVTEPFAKECLENYLDEKGLR